MDTPTWLFQILRRTLPLQKLHLLMPTNTYSALGLYVGERNSTRLMGMKEFDRCLGLYLTQTLSQALTNVFPLHKPKPKPILNHIPNHSPALTLTLYSSQSHIYPYPKPNPMTNPKPNHTIINPNPSSYFYPDPHTALKTMVQPIAF